MLKLAQLSPEERQNRLDYADGENSFNDRYHLGRPKVTQADALLNLRRFHDESAIDQRILGIWPPNIGHLSWHDGILYLHHPADYLDGPGGAPGRARHVAELHAYRELQHGPSTGIGHISPAGVKFIADFEGASANWYWDSLGSVWTIGYGHTGGLPAGFKPPLSIQAQLNLLALDLRVYEAAMRERVTAALDTYQWTALTSFTYNLGAGALNDPAGDGVADRMNRHDINGAANRLLEFDHAGGGVVAGLTRRREGEAVLLRR